MKPLSSYPMNVQLKELDIKINLISGKHENLLANANVTFRFESGEYFTITGFSVWKSKFGGLNVTEPQKAGFKFCFFEKSLWNKVKKHILHAYDYATIPIAGQQDDDLPIL
ncbi:MAG TPA: hypothetical protein VF817_05090 [Patescibacteria group bacterium]